uniref:Flocculation protein FLO11-like n=1 Tax=Anopheles maculatus TaxID=74869 RepID=A0A182SGB9_9DIPT
METVTEEVRCNCTKLAYLRISNETETSESAATETNTMALPSVTQPLPDSTAVPEHGSSTATLTVASEQLPATSLPSTVSLPTNTSDVVTATESDMLTFGSIPDNTTEPTESFPVPSPANTSITDNGPSALLQGGGNETGTTPLRNQSLEVSSIGYTIVGALAIVSLSLVVLIVVYRRRKAVLRLADELHTVPSRSRTQPSPHVRYARFQDEHNMAGDNVSTISDVLTI